MLKTAYRYISKGKNKWLVIAVVVLIGLVGEVTGLVSFQTVFDAVSEDVCNEHKDPVNPEVPYVM
jgi:CheY-specific phosphatase CheX